MKIGKENSIPILSSYEISNFHMHSIEWLPIISNTKHPDFHINRVDDISDKKSFHVLPHRKTYHDFFFLTKGTSKRSKGLNSYVINAPAIFFLPAYQITEHKMISEDAEGFYCHFHEKIFDIFPKILLSEQYGFFQYQSNPVLQLQPNTKQVVENILERLFLLYRKEEYNKNLFSLYLMAMFEELKAVSVHTVAKNRKSNYEITKRYKHALTKHIYEFQNISDYANLLNVTPNYLNKCVKTAIDKTAQDLLKEMLILEAKTLIQHSELNISEIAVKLCDQTPSNFARFFKKQTGLSPKEYAEKN
ncbi:AraC family transcriptional regulator [Aurantibacter crassamenti]|uniref:helix-turn-helix domain-containing protein n=1 Tax=Aurantibacter crassamenti TaxID=1837375 RepID=UPI0019392B8A|nr:helix-turn-helix domain-containing protein [Aurantibacter crassamenti]MBM1107338.1 AraC family transcriptional regulator [Aurantibacter crassamenti]